MISPFCIKNNKDNNCLICQTLIIISYSSQLSKNNKKIFTRILSRNLQYLCLHCCIESMIPFCLQQTWEAWNPFPLRCLPMPPTSAVQWPEDTMKDKTQLTVTMSIKLNTITELKWNSSQVLWNHKSMGPIFHRFIRR